MRNRRRLGVLIGLLLVQGLPLAAQVPSTPPEVEVLRTTGAAIIAGHPEATRLGMQTLKAGGTAADALATVSTALGVVEPGNSGFGGKFVLQYYDAKTKEITCIVAMDESPADMNADEAAKNGSRGAKAACTPGLVAGIAEAHRRWGVRPWKENLLPVARLAEDGFEVSQECADLFKDFPLTLKDPDALALYAPGGRAVQAGDRLTNPDLAETIRQVAEGGEEAFYRGEVARKIAAGVQAKGGWISEADLAAYKVRVVPPLKLELDGLTYYSSPPPTTGGATLLGTLSVMSTFDLTGVRPRDAKYMDIQGRAMQQVLNTTIRGLADVPGAQELAVKNLRPDALAELARKAHAADVRNPFSRTGGNATSSLLPRNSSAAGWIDAEPTLTDQAAQHSTTHLIIVDDAGNIACVTQSIGNHFGSGCVPAGTGILLNSDMNNFGARNGPTGARPRKWPNSTIAPTIVLDKNHNPVIAIGSPASARIPVVIAQVLFDVQYLGRDLGGAVQAPRFHVFRGGGGEGTNTAYTIALEPGCDPKLVDELKALGWHAKIEDKARFYFGTVHAIRFNADGTKTVVADRRRTGDAEVGP